MTPSDVKHYLSEHRQATLQEIAVHFDAEPAAVEGALDLWLRKGKVTRRAAPKCSGCNQCSAGAVMIYQWED
jgi:hypothetical protein